LEDTSNRVVITTTQLQSTHLHAVPQGLEEKQNTLGKAKEASDKELERSVSAILGVEVVTIKFLANYMKGKKLKKSGTKLEQMN
jgi:hypothetical protein